MENDVPEEVTISVKMEDGSARSFQLTDDQRKAVIRALGPWGSALLVLGGISYTAGLLFYRRASLRYMHSVWHLFVLAGSVFQYFCILLFVY